MGSLLILREVVLMRYPKSASNMIASFTFAFFGYINKFLTHCRVSCKWKDGKAVIRSYMNAECKAYSAFRLVAAPIFDAIQYPILEKL